MTFDSAVEKIQEILVGADASQAPDAAFQIHFTNKDCDGTMYIAIEDGKVRAEGYDYKDNTAAIDLKLGDLTKILNGNMNPVTAAEKGTIAVFGDVAKTAVLTTLVKKTEATKPTVQKATAAKKVPAKKPAAAKKTTAKAAPKAVEKETAIIKRATSSMVAKKETAEAKKVAEKKPAVKTTKSK